MRRLPVPAMIFIAVVIALILLALYGYLSGAWEESKPAAVRLLRELLDRATAELEVPVDAKIRWRSLPRDIRL
jgi:hypothetical protein